MMFTLLLVFHISAGSAGGGTGVNSTQIPGYHSYKTCMEDGAKIAKENGFQDGAPYPTTKVTFSCVNPK